MDYDYKSLAKGGRILSGGGGWSVSREWRTSQYSPNSGRALQS